MKTPNRHTRIDSFRGFRFMFMQTKWANSTAAISLFVCLFVFFSLRILFLFTFDFFYYYYLFVNGALCMFVPLMTRHLISVRRENDQSKRWSCAHAIYAEKFFYYEFIAWDACVCVCAVSVSVREYIWDFGFYVSGTETRKLLKFYLAAPHTTLKCIIFQSCQVSSIFLCNGRSVVGPV